MDVEKSSTLIFYVNGKKVSYTKKKINYILELITNMFRVSS